MRRGLMLAFSAVLIPACGGGSGSDHGSGAGGAGASSFSMLCTPGSTSGSTVAGGTAFAGAAGFLNVFSRGNIHFGETPAPAAPLLPQAPTTGTTVTTASIAAAGIGIALDGNLLVSGTVVTPGAGGTFAFTSSDGDIVVSGSLLAGGAAAPDSIQLLAPYGDVYITGSIQTRLGKTAGASGGTFSVIARRIFITGSIDTEGDPNGSGNGGKGGQVILSASTLAGATSLYALGSINASGGSGTTRTVNTASDGGQVLLSANDEAWLMGSVTSNGGSVTGVAGGLTSGNGGFITLSGGAGATVNTAISLCGGSVSTTGVGTANGNAGNTIYGGFPGGFGGFLYVNNPGGTLPNPSGPVSVFGTFTANGGAASAASGTAAAPICAGDCGGIIVGDSTGTGGPASVEMGSGTISLRGGTSGDMASYGGVVVVANYFTTAPDVGNVVFRGTVDLTNGSGGNAFGTYSAAPLFQVEAFNGDVLLSGSATLGGGSAIADLFTAAAPTVSIRAGQPGTNGSIFSSASITTNGPDSRTGDGGHAGNMIFQVLDPTGQLTLLPGSFLSANGGTGSGPGFGGEGGVIELGTYNNGAGSGTISVSGTISAQGGVGGGGGGQGGRLLVDSCQSGSGIGGDVRLETGALVDLSGGAGPVGGYARASGGPTTATRTFPGPTSCALEIWTHGSGVTPAEPTFPIATGGRLINNGTIRALGGVSNGGGGDLNIDAFKADGSAAVGVGDLGTTSVLGAGTGPAGTITLH